MNLRAYSQFHFNTEVCFSRWFQLRFNFNNYSTAIRRPFNSRSTAVWRCYDHPTTGRRYDCGTRLLR